MLLSVVLSPLGVPSVAQGNELIVMAKASKASGTVGVIEDSTGAGIGNAEVIRFDCETGRFKGALDPLALNRTRTNADGDFVLNWSGKRVVCLQVQALGMDTLQVEVKRSHSAGRLHLRLKPGT